MHLAIRRIDDIDDIGYRDFDTALGCIADEVCMAESLYCRALEEKPTALADKLRELRPDAFE